MSFYSKTGSTMIWDFAKRIMGFSHNNNDQQQQDDQPSSSSLSFSISPPSSIRSMHQQQSSSTPPSSGKDWLEARGYRDSFSRDDEIQPDPKENILIR